MRILVLGGTVFLGRHFVEAALANGHEVTLFHRGQRGADLFPQVERILGERDGGMDALGDRSWDAVLDTCGYYPRVVAQSVEKLRDKTGVYAFVSSISVFKDFTVQGLTEDDEVITLDDPTVEEIRGDTYGGLKALCEQAVRDGFPLDNLIIRPGLIVGPNDPSDRFTYWPARFARGGKVLAMDRKDQPVQLIDVRDLAQWILRMIEAGSRGTCNATGPNEPMQLGDVMERCRKAVGGDSEIVWVDPKFLEEKEVGMWMELPLCLGSDPSSDGIGQVDCSRALAEGLTFRPLEQTIADTLEWHRSRPQPVTLANGLNPEKEARLLEEWAERQPLASSPGS